jgi:hypothetical protein
MGKSIFIIFISSFIGLFTITNTFCSESYRGRIEPDLSGRGADIYLKKEKGNNSLDFLKNLLEMDALINEKNNDNLKLLIEAKKLEIEREKLRILQEEIANQNRKQSEEENKTQEINNESSKYSHINNYTSTRDTYNSYTSTPVVSSEPFEVYFNNGNTAVCDKAWQDGDTIYLVYHDKKFAVGYDKSEINMSKTFR